MLPEVKLNPHTKPALAFGHCQISQTTKALRQPASSFRRFGVPQLMAVLSLNRLAKISCNLPLDACRGNYKHTAYSRLGSKCATKAQGKKCVPVATDFAKAE